MSAFITTNRDLTAVTCKTCIRMLRLRASDVGGMTNDIEGALLLAGEQVLRKHRIPRVACTGCGDTRTIAELRKAHPRALSCCPERKMVKQIIEYFVVPEFSWNGTKNVLSFKIVALYPKSAILKDVETGIKTLSRAGKRRVEAYTRYA